MNGWITRALQNWKSTLAGVAAFLSGVPGFVTALTAWAHHDPVDWRQVGVSVALTFIGGGLASAKDNDVHSTTAQIVTSTIQNPAIQATAVVEAKQAAVEEDLGKEN